MFLLYLSTQQHSTEYCEGELNDELMSSLLFQKHSYGPYTGCADNLLHFKLSHIQESCLGSWIAHFIECNTYGCFLWTTGAKCINCRVGVFSTNNTIVFMSFVSQVNTQQSSGDKTYWKVSLWGQWGQQTCQSVPAQFHVEFSSPG